MAQEPAKKPSAGPRSEVVARTGGMPAGVRGRSGLGQSCEDFPDTDKEVGLVWSSRMIRMRQGETC